MTSICMGKQSEATPFGEGENVHLAMRRTLTHPAHFRPRVRQILDSGRSDRMARGGEFWGGSDVPPRQSAVRSTVVRR